MQPKEKRSLRVLLVDDEEVGHDTLGVYLSDSGMEVRHATNGSEALEAFSASHCDLVITAVCPILPVLWKLCSR